MNAASLQPSVKVWQPRGFEGLEVEMIENLSMYRFNGFQSSYELSVGVLEGSLGMIYAGRKFENDFPKPTFMFNVQHADEHVEVWSKGHTLLHYSYTIRPDTNLLISILRDASVIYKDKPFFQNTIVEDASVDQWLAQRTYDVVRLFTESNAHLHREIKLVELIIATTQQLTDVRISQPKLGLEHQAVKQVKNYLREHFASEVSLEDLSALTNLNKYHLLQIFKRDVGLSPHIYQTSLRVHRAKQLLAKGLPIAHVALDVGFVDQSHFGRQFKKHVYVTPGRFQQDSLNG